MKALLIAVALAIPIAASADDTKGIDKPKTQDPAYNSPPPGAEITTPPSDVKPVEMPKAGAEPGVEVSSADAAVNKLNKVNEKHIVLGTLAQARASNEQVKKLGEKMVKDHQKLNTEIIDYAKKKNITLSNAEPSAGAEAVPPEAMPPSEKMGGAQGGTMGGKGNDPMAGAEPPAGGSMGTPQGGATPAEPPKAGEEFARQLDELKNLTGTEFDSKFLSNVIDNSSKFVSKLNSFKGKGDKDLDKLLDREVKLIDEHAKDAKKLQGKIPAA